jgi:glycosyltransferase involved in cell wall biosynthesis
MLDMWPFLGAEHYLHDSDNPRFLQGYERSNRSSDTRGFDICKFVWNLKIKHFKNLNLVSPSKWLASEAKKSKLFNENEISIIPPPIQSEIFKSVDKEFARSSFGVDRKKFTIGYLGGITTRKGWNFVKELCSYPELNTDWQFLLGGASKDVFLSSIKIRNNVSIAGRLESTVDLVKFYSSIDVLLVPSTSEAYGLVAQEAQTIGLPVVVFKNTGAEDTVIDGLTGLVCTERSVVDLIQAIESLYKQDLSKKLMAANFSRERAKKEWNLNIIGSKYLELYQRVRNQM